jgi:hypothetical protein
MMAALSRSGRSLLVTGKAEMPPNCGRSRSPMLDVNVGQLLRRPPAVRNVAYVGGSGRSAPCVRFEPGDRRQSGGNRTFRTGFVRRLSLSVHTGSVIGRSS